MMLCHLARPDCCLLGWCRTLSAGPHLKLSYPAGMMWVWVAIHRMRCLAGRSFRLPARALVRRVRVPRAQLSDPSVMMWVWVLVGVSGRRWRLLGALPRVLMP